MLEVRDLRVYFRTLDGVLKAVDGLSFALERGKSLGIVGESGCGKSVAARSILRLLPEAITVGEILYRPDSAQAALDLIQLPPHSQAIRLIRGQEIAMIFQEPMTSLTPVYTIGEQIMETIRLHQGVDGDEARRRAIDMLGRVGIPDSDRRVDDYPHQMSGGMRQRVSIAIALSCEPSILIADEPTTALDVTIQAQILQLLRDLRVKTEMSLIMITHDLAVIAEMADEVLVMYLGQLAEWAPATVFFGDPRHPYSRALARSIIDLGTKPKALLPSIKGNVPNPLRAPSGCHFRDRCEFAHERCTEAPPSFRIEANHIVRCWLYDGADRA